MTDESSATDKSPATDVSPSTVGSPSTDKSPPTVGSPSTDESLATDESPGGMPVEEGAPIWMTTFGDLMSLLLTFFVLLFSMSEIRADKFAAAAQSMREALGGTAVIEAIIPKGLVSQPADPRLRAAQADAGDDPAPEGVDPALNDGGQPSASEVLADKALKDIAVLVNEFIRLSSLEETLLVTEGPTGVRVRIKAGALFRPGVGMIEDDARWIIDFLAGLSVTIEVPVVVVGHADNQPIGTAQFRSNWELSAFRAAGIVRLLAEGGVDPDHLRVESLGSTRPIATNETPEGRAENRRVELFYDRNNLIEEIERLRSEVAEGN